MSGPVQLSAADRFAIEDLFALYHWALDTGDVDGFADTLIEAGVVELVMPQKSTRFEGRSGMIALAEGLRQWDRFPGCQHFSGQMQLEPLSADRNRVRSFCGVAECRGEPPYALRFAGRSDDIVVRSGERWLFERRHVRLWAGEALRDTFL